MLLHVQKHLKQFACSVHIAIDGRHTETPNLNFNPWRTFRLITLTVANWRIEDAFQYFIIIA